MLDKNVELFYEPLEISKRLSQENRAEMEEWQLAFLCGLLKKYRPKKIVEVGVAAGGTTAVILNCISMLDLTASVYSVDLCREYYRDKSKRTGYMAEECKALLEKPLSHQLYTGKLGGEYAEEIEGDIDFLILDTAHCLPGELLDFLAYFPYLKTGCVVVLHDIALNYYGYPYHFATKVLFDTVVGEKIASKEGEILSNIGAFLINDDTGKYIQNVFSALTLTWWDGYVLGDKELSIYRRLYEKFYADECLELFDIAVRMNKEILRQMPAIKYREILRQMPAIKFREFADVYRWAGALHDKSVYIYGCGNWGKQLYMMLTQLGICCAGYIISDGQCKNSEKVPVYYLSEIHLDKTKETILIGVGPALRKEICAALRTKGITEYVIPDNIQAFLAMDDK